jgi:hypothetical protein
MTVEEPVNNSKSGSARSETRVAAPSAWVLIVSFAASDYRHHRASLSPKYACNKRMKVYRTQLSPFTNHNLLSDGHEPHEARPDRTRMKREGRRSNGAPFSDKKTAESMLAALNCPLR